MFVYSDKSPSLSADEIWKNMRQYEEGESLVDSLTVNVLDCDLCLLN